MTTENDESLEADLNAEVLLLAEATGFDQPLATTFADLGLQLLVEAGDLLAPIAGEVSKRTSQISAVDWDDERHVLSCIVSLFSSDQGTVEFGRAELLTGVARLTAFIEEARAGSASSMISTDSARDLALTIEQTLPEADRLQLFVLTNQLYLGDRVEIADIGGVKTELFVRDVKSLRALSDVADHSAGLDVRMVDFSSPGIEALGPISSGPGHSVYLVILPGDLLADIYAAFGPRLLELNVRSFLQARNKVNRGIQQTIATEPEVFLAFNNGLSLTASAVERTMAGGRLVISTMNDLQIVNGGQTTASLYHAKYRLKADLRRVQVQAKLTVLESETRSELAPKISLYANSQNPIRMADFSANDPFHVAIQRISRGAVVPPNSAAPAGSKWFYERSRGQYADLASAANSPAKLSQLRAEYPVRQKFMKTDIAKYELLWDQRPHTVALGGEKYFSQFMQLLRERPSQVVPDETYFQHLIAKAILWKSADLVVSRLGLGGYKAQTVGYTMSLISKRTAQRIDLPDVWNRQAPPEAWEDAITRLAPLVHNKLIESAGSRNVSEWAKRADCWAAVETIDWHAPAALVSAREYAVGRSITAPSQTGTSLPASDDELAARSAVESFGGTAWFELSAWAKDTNNLAPWQRGLAFSLGRLTSQSKIPSEKQALRGVEILVEAERLGFRQSGASPGPE